MVATQLSLVEVLEPYSMDFSNAKNEGNGRHSRKVDKFGWLGSPGSIKLTVTNYIS